MRMNAQTTPMTTRKIKPERISGKDNWIMILMCLPVFVSLLVFNYIPMLGVVMAFQEFRADLGIFNSSWVGFDNFVFFFTSGDAMRVTFNTVFLNALFIIAGTVAAVVIALLLFEVVKKWLIKVYQTFMILPSFLSWVVVGFMTYALFSSTMGLLTWDGGIRWYEDASVWPAILTIAVVWKNVGLNCIIYYAGLMNVNQEYYEAAAIDGAGKLKQAWYISLPSLVPLISIMTILAIGGIMRADFGMFYNLTRDVPVLYPTTDVIDTFVFRMLRVVPLGEGMGAAVGLYQSVVGFVLIVVTNMIVNKFQPDNALF